MNKIIFTRGYHPLTSAEIAEFESGHGIILPPKYRAFLLRQNGGHPHKQLIPDLCYVQFFCSLTDASKRASLDRAISSVALSDGLLPIGYGAGDYICLSLVDDQIYLWDHDAEYAFDAMPPALSEMKLIAVSIDEFLTRLEGTKPPRLEDEVERIGRWGKVDVLDAFLATGRDINEIMPSGNCIVKAAVDEEDLVFLKECVRRGAVLQGRGLLHAAAFKMDVEMIRYLLGQGLDPNELDENGKTPLDSSPRGATGPSVLSLEQAGGHRTQNDT